MHYPEENRSVSIRRSDRASRISRIEMASPRSPRSFRLPLSPRSYKSAPVTAHQVNTPVIVLDETVAPGSRLQVTQPQGLGSPNVLKVPPTSAATSAADQTSNTTASPRPSTATVGSGLGITPSPTSTAEPNKNNEENQHDNEVTENLPNNKAERLTSWISSNLSIRNNNNNNTVVPTGGTLSPNIVSSPIIRLDNNINNDHGVIYDDDATKEKMSVINEEEQVEVEHFMAFKSRPWWNPFYVAIVSCGLLVAAVVFMVIYDLTMLGLGNNVFG